MDISDDCIMDMYPSLCSGNVFQHFKGGIYVIVTVARDSETLALVVIYKNIKTGVCYSRAIGNFLESVDVNGTPVLRFKRIGNI